MLQKNNIKKKLELSYRVLLLCSIHTPFSSKKTYDIEVWMLGQKTILKFLVVLNAVLFKLED